MKERLSKKEISDIAIAHTKQMEEKYSTEIGECIETTETYWPTEQFQTVDKVPEFRTIVLDDTDTVSAAFKYGQGKTCILNFASYTSPGGGFRNGSIAQEECLCHESVLYNVLSEKKDYYAFNREHKNGELYDNRALYTENVIFVHDHMTERFDVLTCAAPNKRAQTISTLKQNDDALRSRIRFIMRIMEERGVQTAILGAFGCGVFGQDPTAVAETFLEECMQRNIETYIFAIPDGGDGNYTAFKNVLESKEG